MAYSPPEFKNEITLPLSRNESVCAIDDLPTQLGGLSTEFVTRYPAHAELQALIGQWIGVDPERIVVTAGGDDSIDRVMRKSITSDRKKIVSHVPSFEMIDIYAGNYGGQLEPVEWLAGEFPADRLIAKIDSSTAIVVIVSPNNPTGGSISTHQILRIAAAAKSAGCKLLVDNAYIEFADTDPTADLTSIDNVMIVRTFSKAWGLAGLRVGYLIAPNVEYATFIRNSAGPFPVSAVSLETARCCLADYQSNMTANVAMIKSIRALLIDLLEQCAAKPLPSSGNFVLAEFSESDRVWDGLA
jgi:histidinol-phosphate/aromatic aminotransferase/cobyric acid decarboxylase-like protein